MRLNNIDIQSTDKYKGSIDKAMFNWMRVSWMVLANLFHAPIWLHEIRKMSKDDSITKEDKYAYLQRMVDRINTRGRVKVISDGQENLPSEDGYIMFPNHQGYYDVLGIIVAAPRMFGVVIKKEAANWPLVKDVLSLIHGIPMDRSNIRSSLEVINQMTEHVKGGGNFLIFPEGTCSHSNKLLPMKGGSFKSAVHANCPIVPVAQMGAWIPFDTGGVKRTEVRIHFLPAIYPDEYQGMRTVEIAQLVHDRIQAYIDTQI